jgi:hypothetical protein
MPLIDREEFRKLIVSLAPDFPEPDPTNVEAGAWMMEQIVERETKLHIESMRSARFQAGLNDALDKFMNFSGEDECDNCK